MHKVSVKNKILFAQDGELLSDCLIKASLSVDHPCGMRGVCKKCLVLVNGEKQLSCQYRIKSDIKVDLPDSQMIKFQNNTDLSDENSETVLVLDLGTTTIVMACISLKTKEILSKVSCPNPQKIFGADVISRVDYCKKNTVKLLNNTIINAINKLVSSLNLKEKQVLYVAGNTVMLHILFNTDCSSIGTAPYTPVFLESKTETGEKLGIKNVSRVVSLPNISSFVGADIVAGLNLVEKPSKEKSSLLVDLGTNAEVVLFSDDEILCTAAAAGPCFEGANIECGSSAVNGAVSAFELEDSKKMIKTVGAEKPQSICATGLIDIVAQLLKNGYIDETGFMKQGRYDISENVYISQNDVRQFQLAKSAVSSVLSSLVEIKGIDYEDIEKVFISGGFSTELNIENAVLTGLIPKALKNKCVTVDNSCLNGTIKYAIENNDLKGFVSKAKYVDLSCNAVFTQLFIENMLFNGDLL